MGRKRRGTTLVPFSLQEKEKSWNNLEEQRDKLDFARSSRPLQLWMAMTAGIS